MEKENRFYEGIKNFVLRMAAGLLLISILNPSFERVGIQARVGMNPVSAITAGVLGVPGVAMLYGIAGSGELIKAMSG